MRLPLALEVRDREVLVIGAGRLGAQKATQLLECGAVVDVIALEVLTPIPDGVRSLSIRGVRPTDVLEYWLVVAATGDASVNDEIVAVAHEHRVWLNVVDDPERSSLYFMALARTGDVTVAVGTEGASPALARHLRDLLAAALPKATASAARHLRNLRSQIHASGRSTFALDWGSTIASLLDEDDPRRVGSPRPDRSPPLEP